MCPKNATFYVNNANIYNSSIRKITLPYKSSYCRGTFPTLQSKKSTFVQTIINCLSSVSQGSIRPNANKIKALLNIPKPTTVCYAPSWQQSTFTKKNV